ncbi:hypothetical protein ACHAXS_012457, partial [Conticribra weissflogii]
VSTLSLTSILFGAIALVLSWIGNLNCQFLKFTTQNTNESHAIQFGIWFFQYWTAATSIDGTFIFETCHHYPSQTSSGEPIDLDAQWKTARAFSILTFLFGISLFLYNIFLSCRTPTQRLFTSPFEGMGYLLASFCSGMTLILLDSKLCTDNIMMDGVKAAYPDIDWTETCSISKGARSVISATVIYFLAGVASLHGYRMEERENIDESGLSEPLYPEENN